MVKLELTERQARALVLAIDSYDREFFSLTEDNPDYRERELAWADLGEVYKQLFLTRYPW